jgi:hypothetical protein
MIKFFRKIRQNMLRENKNGTYFKYAALTALGTYMILNPQKAKAQSPEPPGGGFF